MQWLGLKKTPGRETQKKARQGKRKNDSEINKRLRIASKGYTARKGKDVLALPTMEFVTCKCKNKCTDSLPTEIRKLMYSFGVFQVLINDNSPLTEFYLE